MTHVKDINLWPSTLSNGYLTYSKKSGWIRVGKY